MKLQDVSIDLSIYLIYLSSIYLRGAFWYLLSLLTYTLNKYLFSITYQGLL